MLHGPSTCPANSPPSQCEHPGPLQSSASGGKAVPWHGPACSVQLRDSRLPQAALITTCKPGGLQIFSCMEPLLVDQKEKDRHSIIVSYKFINLSFKQPGLHTNILIVAYRCYTGGLPPKEGQDLQTQSVAHILHATTLIVALAA